MYYDRKLTDNFKDLLEQNGIYRWLFDYVKGNVDLDFLIGRNKQKQWISIYRGLSKIVSIETNIKADKIRIDAALPYKRIAAENNLAIYGEKDNTDLSKDKLDCLITKIRTDPKFNRYYANKKEGYYQTILSRQYGICGGTDSQFVIIDKEVVLGYTNQLEKRNRYDCFRDKYKRLQGIISKNDPVRFGKYRNKKAIGNEVDFLALDRKGNILLIEYKHGENISGIYLSPLQIGLYYDLFNDYYENNTALFSKAIFAMLEQKQRLGLINPLWEKPPKLKRLIPVLVISEYNSNTAAKDNFKDIMAIIRKELRNQKFLKDLRVYNYMLGSGLTNLDWSK